MKRNHLHRCILANKLTNYIFCSSWDELQRYDLPAVIDYVLKTTNQSQVNYIGHSQGTLIGFAAFSSNPTLANKVADL